MNRAEIQHILNQPYNFEYFKNGIFKPIFASKVKEVILWDDRRIEEIELGNTERKVAKSIRHYGYIQTRDERLIDLFEVVLQDNIIIERNKVSVGSLIKKHIWGDNAAFANFVYSENKGKDWRFSFISREFELKDGQFIAKDANPKRYSYILGENETCKTAALRFEELSKIDTITIENIREAFSVEKMSKKFFDDYRDIHYHNLIVELTANHKGRGVFKAKTEKLEAKRIRDFAKKLLGRIVFLYFVQKKGWLGVPKGGKWGEGDRNFMQNLFLQSGKDKNFYYIYLTELFFNTLNNDRRGNQDLKSFHGHEVRIPYLNGGLFDKEDLDDHPIIISAAYFDALFEFFNQYNFTVHEDSREEQLVAVDPEMLGHIFENLLEDNKDKGAFYTPKEIVHYMCQSSLIEYLVTALSNNYTVYQQIGKDQLEIFGNETRTGQLSLVSKMGETALNKAEIDYIVKEKDVKTLSKTQLRAIKSALDEVKVCDPAIGSGAFPMGILLEILTIKERIAVELNQTWDAAKEKEYIIKNNIYGVDIEKGAVDIARLRFWLSLIVDEDEPHQLPNLDYRIMQGNSVLESFEDIDLSIPRETSLADLGTDRFSKNEVNTLTKLADEYFEPSIENKDKEGIKSQIDSIVNNFINDIVNRKKKNLEEQISKIQMGLAANVPKGGDAPGIINKKERTITRLKKELNKVIPKLEVIEDQEKRLLQFRKTDEKPFFLWSLYFNDVYKKGGFDIIIANPPYLGQKGNKEVFQKILNSNLGKLYHQRRMDLFYFFIHFSILNVRNDGIICFITTNYYPTATYSDKLRKHISEEVSCIQFIDFNELKIFDSASGQHNLISVFQKGRDENYKCSITRVNKYGSAKESDLTDIFDKRSKYATYFTKLNKDLFEEGTNYIRIHDTSSDSTRGKIYSILKRLKGAKNSRLIGDYFNVEQGIVSGADKVTSRHIKKFPNFSFEKDEGIFVLTKEEVENLNLDDVTSTKYIKPTYKNSDISKWGFIPPQKIFVIYIKSYGRFPNYDERIIKHLDKFKIILINRNVRKGQIDLSEYEDFVSNNHDISYIMNASSMRLGNYYCLSYARNGVDTFESLKIVNSRRAKSNIFAIEDEKQYEQSDIVVTTLKDIPSNPFSIYYALGILNSKLYHKWFYFFGKRKGEILELFQKPITETPLLIPNNLAKRLIENIVIYNILIAKNKIEGINHFVKDEYVVKQFEEVLDALIFELHFPQEFQDSGIEIAKYVERDFTYITDKMNSVQKSQAIETAYRKLREPDNEIRNNMKLMRIELKDLLMPILSV